MQSTSLQLCSQVSARRVALDSVVEACCRTWKATLRLRSPQAKASAAYWSLCFVVSLRVCSCHQPLNLLCIFLHSAGLLLNACQLLSSGAGCGCCHPKRFPSPDDSPGHNSPLPPPTVAPQTATPIPADIRVTDISRLSSHAHRWRSASRSKTVKKVSQSSFSPASRVAILLLGGSAQCGLSRACVFCQPRLRWSPTLP